MTVVNIKDARYIKFPDWNEGVFSDENANIFWSELPNLLKEIVLTEMAQGNRVSQILRNDKRGIVLVELERGPLSIPPKNPHLIIHDHHEYGNYCYDGTKCTYEDSESNCFIAFVDPDYEE